MLYSFITGIDILNRYKAELARGQFKVVIFFLATVYDSQLLEDIKRLDRDIDRLTGPHALAIAFMPPSLNDSLPRIGNNFNKNTDSFEAAGRNWNPGEFDSFANAMTQNAYDLADLFYIPYNDLPSIVFVNPQDLSEVATLKLDDKGLSPVYGRIREVFGEWYKEHRKMLDKADQLLLFANNPLTIGFPGSSSSSSLGEHFKTSRMRRLFDDFIRETVYLIVEKGMLELISKTSVDEGKVKQQLIMLYKHPLKLESRQSGILRKQRVVDFLKEENLSINLIGEQITWDRFQSRYFELISNAASQELQMRKVNPPPFPLRKLENIDKNVIFKKPSKSRFRGALQAGGKEAFKELIDHPLVNIFVAAIEAWQEAD
ncbi:MAG: hypothetical protein HCA25_00505 (plasmid) [Dolichospermum sp. DET50]|nr:hypothetical protein [Dolichospermum sp. DET66]MBS3035983.1 hypothetical protein [Dolichospermum sp. DET67]MBS3041151.1 hypothetical protein [Dolichospermum sp. DET50]QSX70892.1 MAG: hypothetical protein EZY12_27230 [Dolichospermum sp. DET69]